MKTKRRKLTAVQRAAQFCGAAFEMDAFEPQWKRLLDVLGDWCDANKSEIVWAAIGLYSGELVFVVGYPDEPGDRRDALFAFDASLAHDDRLDLIQLAVHAMHGRSLEHYRNQTSGELHRFIG